MTTPHELLSQANTVHDDEPQRAAALLRQLDAKALDAADAPLFAFLLNHVLGEKLGQWQEAHALMSACHGLRAPAVLRQAAVAAAQAGDAAAQTRLTAELALALDGPAAQAAELVALTRAGYLAPGLDAAQAGALVLAALEGLQSSHWLQASRFDAPAAASCNNLASGLGERELADYDDAALAGALLLAAERSQWLWGRAGDWVHRERACYGRAVALNTLGVHEGALQQAHAGLVVLDQHDHGLEQSVDRAFLELERAHACTALGQAAEAAQAASRAQHLAKGFDDESLRAWFEQRRQRLAALAARA